MPADRRDGSTASSRRVSGRRGTASDSRRRSAVLQLLPAAIPDGLVVYDPDLRYVVWNPAMERITGIPAERVLGKPAFSPYQDGTIPAEGRAQLLRALAGEVCSAPLVFKATAPDGKVYRASCSYLPVRDRHGRIAGVAGLVRFEHVSGGMLERTAAERDRYRSLLNTMHEGVWVIDRACRTVFASDRMANMLGVPSHELVRRSIEEFLHPRDRGLFLRVFQKHPGTDVDTPRECGFIRADGGVLHADISIAPVSDPHGDSGEVIVVVADISTHKEVERQRAHMLAGLVQAEKMAAVGSLASGIAHELNNVLQVILSSAWVVQKTTDAKRCAALQTIIEASEQAGVVLKNIMSLARPPVDPSGTECSLHTLAQHVVSLMEQRLRSAGIAVRWIASDPAYVLVRPPELMQVVLTLITNAMDAMMPNGGELQLTTAVDGARTARLSVRDTGCGIPPPLRRRLFEPFFSTKSILAGGTRAGAGLGLYVAYHLIKQHGGELTYEPADPGSIFHVRLPAVPKREQP